MKQLRKSLPSVFLIGILTTSCSEKATNVELQTENQNVIKYRNAVKEKKTYSIAPVEIMPNGFTSGYNYYLPGNFDSFINSRDSKNQISLTLILFCILLTLSVCKVHVENIDDEATSVESELKRLRKINKK